MEKIEIPLFKLSPLRQLDEILDILSLFDSAISFKVLFDNLEKRRIKISRQQAVLVLKKLEKDGFTELSTSIGDLSKKEIINTCIITFEGKVFLETGGYIKEEKRKSKAATLQSWQTWAIAGGTALAGVYGFYEILKETGFLFAFGVQK